MNRGCRRKDFRTAVAVCMSFAAGAGVAAPAVGGLDLSGALGYSYRAFDEDDGAREDFSHQLLTNMAVTNYFWQPWLAKSRLSLNFTQDSSGSSDELVDTTTDARLITGDWSLNVLPESKTPFALQYQLSDSRIDREGVGQTPITFAGEDYSSSFLGLRQSYVLENGGRYQLRTDLRSWDSQISGRYDDKTFGLEADLRAPKHHFTARNTYKTNEHSLSSRTNESKILELNHYYFPARSLRFDGRAMFYEYDRSFLDPASSDTRLSSTDIAQLSGFAFWRPATLPLSVSGGVRVALMDGLQGGVAANNQFQVSANLGAFYFYNNNLRFDAALNSTLRETDDLKEGFHRQHIGGLYQTDWHEMAGAMYQGYGSLAIDNVAEPDDSHLELQGAVGHNISRTWWLGERTSATSVRASLNQALRFMNSGAESDLDGAYQYFDNSLTLSFNQRAWGGDTLALLTLSDSRELGVSNTQQMVHMQLSRGQDLGRRSSITGDVTVQYVKSTYEGVMAFVDARDTATSTARLSFSHSQLLGVPRLGFVSDFMLSRISTEGAIDRQDWDSRITYLIGKLESSVSYRLTETDMHNYDLIYFKVMRRF